MKKYMYIGLLIMALICIICFANHNDMSRYDAFVNKEQPILNEIGLQVYQIDSGYLVLTMENGEVTKAVEFSEEREARNVFGLHLQQTDDIRCFLGKTLEKVEQSMGKFHAQTGSGFFIPSYITSDGYLIKLWLEDSIITHVSRVDLFSGEGVEWFSLSDIDNLN